MDAESWLASGEQVAVDLRSGRYDVFVRVTGAGPWLTLLHAFPTSSWDWSRVTPALEQRFRVLAFDFLGFGDSDKPYPHDYSIAEQADLVEALWSRFDVGRTGLVAHDFGATVVLELLAWVVPAPTAAVLLNAALYPELARPLFIQRLLARPRLGRLLARLTSERTFARSISAVSKVSPADLHEQWLLLRRRDGTQVIPSLLGYMRERRANAARWVAALEQTAVPLHLVWGMNDLRSGARVADHVLQRIPGARLVPLEVGHYPQLEAPREVAQAIASAFQ